MYCIQISPVTKLYSLPLCHVARQFVFQSPQRLCHSVLPPSLRANQRKFLAPSGKSSCSEISKLTSKGRIQPNTYFCKRRVLGGRSYAHSST